jgi:hypothetical protein
VIDEEHLLTFPWGKVFAPPPPPPAPGSLAARHPERGLPAALWRSFDAVRDGDAEPLAMTAAQQRRWWKERGLDGATGEVRG